MATNLLSKASAAMTALVIWGWMTPASACVGGLNHNGAHALINNCLYTVLVKFTSTGGDGVVGPLRPGSWEATYVSVRHHMQWRWCDYNEWNRGHCNL